MKLFTGIIFCSLVVGVSGEGWFSFFKEAVQVKGKRKLTCTKYARMLVPSFTVSFVYHGRTSDLLRAYWDMKEANYQNSGRYFRARGNYEASQRGPGGIWAAKIISNVGGYFQGLLHYFGSSYEREDQVSNQRAEEWGRSGQDPGHFRPAGLPEKY